MKRFLFVCILFISFGLFSCQNDDDPLTEPELFYGSWNWEQTSGGFLSLVATPQTAGVSQVIEFRDDGLYFTFVDDDIVDFGNYTLTLEQSRLTKEPAYIVRFEGSFNGLAITEISKTRLVLTQECVDCFVYEFSR